MSRRTEEVKKEIKVVRAKVHKKTTFFDLKVNGVNIYGCRFIEGSNGNFVGFPSYKSNTNDKYYNHVWVELSEEDVKLIDSQIDDLLDK